jgi:tetratricopeptide (TPR) repeat protein
MTRPSARLSARLAPNSPTSARLESMSRHTLVHPPLMLGPRPPLSAYREDLARRGGVEAFGPSDATWLSVATILSHAVDVPTESRAPLAVTLREVVDGDPALRDLLGASEPEPPADFELDGVSPIVRAIVERMEDDGALNLAYSVLSTLAEADLRLSVLERGRVLAQLGRVAWKAGALDTAREQYRRAEVLGRTARIPELRVRAWVGYSVVARLRGNYPEVRKWAARGAHEAERAGLTALASLAYHNLMISAAVAGDLNGALVYGWRAFEHALGDSAREADMLANISQYLLVSGHPDVAIHGFAATLARCPTARVALPALGGMALAACALGNADRVRAIRARAESLIETVGLPYESASTLLELSEALATVGDARGAAECQSRAVEIAGRQGYHELTHRSEAVEAEARPFQADAPHALDPQAAAVARAVASLGSVVSGASAE